MKLRPIYYRNKTVKLRTFGRAIRRKFDGALCVALSYERCCKLSDSGLEIVRHECAHIAAGIKHGGWGHGEQWKAIYDLSVEFMARPQE